MKRQLLINRFMYSISEQVDDKEVYLLLYLTTIAYTYIGTVIQNNWLVVVNITYPIEVEKIYANTYINFTIKITPGYI